MFSVATRRGKQFNSMVFSETDPLTGAGRDSVYIDAADAAALGLGDGAAVVLRSELGEMTGHLKVVRLAARSLQVHWPEGNVLLPSGPTHREPGSQVPDYNALVTVEPLE
jgi:anaerobic selenocysteine-containing dehydrogenase